MKTQEMIEIQIQEVFIGKIEKIKFNEDSSGILATFNTDFRLCDSMIKGLQKVGLLDIKRSGPGLKISITYFKN